MKFLLSILASLFIALPVFATDVVMGAGANLVFEPNDITINVGDTVRFVNDALPPHNVIVKDHPDFSHEGLAFAPGESFEITFPEAGDFNFVCGPHEGAGMTGTIHVK